MALSCSPPSQRHQGRHQPPCIDLASKTQTSFFGHAYKTVLVDNERRLSAELRPAYIDTHVVSNDLVVGP